MPLLRENLSVLLALPVRLSYLSGLHGGKHLGDVVQCHYLAVPGLRRSKRVRESIMQTMGIEYLKIED